MKSALTAFRESVAQLRQHLDCIALESELVVSGGGTEASSERDSVALRLQNHIGAGVWKRHFDYNSTIISLYGALERYVEDLVRGYVNRMSSSVSSYTNVPDPVRTAHVNGTLSLINRINQRRYRGSLTTADLVANLHSCLGNAEPYRLNLDAFVLHTANYRSDVIDETLRKVGITDVSKRLPAFTPLVTYFAEKYGGRVPGTATPSELFFYIDDLIERRNEVSHGSVSELLSADLLREYVAFVELYACALFELTYGDSMAFEVPHRARSLGKALKIFNDVIVCFEVENMRIAVGDELVAKTADAVRPFKVGPILEIQIDQEALAVVEPEFPTKIALRVEYKAKANHEFYLLQN